MSFKKILKQLIACGVIYAIATLGLYLSQRSFIYEPEDFAVPISATNGSRSLQDFDVTTKGDLKLKGWYSPATSHAVTIVFFHGNGDQLRSAAPIATPYINAGYGFLLVEYPGYSGEAGSPSEQSLYDAARAYIHALEDSGVKTKDMVLFGHSLGSGVAVQMATEFETAGLILLAPFTSLVDVARDRFFIFPVDDLLKDRYDNIHKIGSVTAPVLIANGEKDRVVSPAMGKALYVKAAEPKQFQSYPEHGHNDLFDDFSKTALSWLDQLPVWGN